MRVQTETKGKSASAISSTWRLRPSAYSDEAGSDDDLGILPVLVTVMVMVVVVVMVVMIFGCDEDDASPHYGHHPAQRWGRWLNAGSCLVARSPALSIIINIITTITKTTTTIIVIIIVTTPPPSSSSSSTCITNPDFHIMLGNSELSIKIKINITLILPTSSS